MSLTTELRTHMISVKHSRQLLQHTDYAVNRINRWRFPSYATAAPATLSIGQYELVAIATSHSVSES